MLTTAEIDGMRDTSRSALPATCTITRTAGPGTFDSTTGLYDNPTPTTIYTGPCRVRPQDTQQQDTEVGDLHETLGRYVATLPYDADGVQVDDFLTVTDGTDSQLADRPLRVLHVGWSEWEIDRRLIVEDREQPRVEVGS